ncbi:MAG TPA: 2-phospho-L-lactate guanylyltransferase [Solirubrobacteraceae bacterium]|jgi:2-phospho-L-lactate guanylyltransferase
MATTTFAILPIKSFENAKRRLGEGLDPTPRRALVEAMFSDVLVALRRAALVDQVVVVTSHHGAERIAGGYGALVIEDREEGHNEAASLGVQRALGLGADRALLVPGDCPLLLSDEIDELIRRPAVAGSVLVVPDRHGSGTNALLLTPPDAMGPSFGPGSRERHESHARSQGLEVATVTVPTLALDVDTPDDLVAVESELDNSHGGAAHTRGMLRQLSRSQGRWSQP